jgi:hypothetical protein
MRRISRHLMSAILFCAAFSLCGAQETSIKPGASIRFKTDSTDARQFGYLARLTSDSLFLESCDICSRLFFSRAEINHLDVLRVENRGDRFIAGLAIGALVGGGLGYLSAHTCGGGDKCDLAALAIPFGAIGGGLIGGVIGVFTAYKWQPITSDAH